jgi:hypothetical protein
VTALFLPARYGPAGITPLPEGCDLTGVFPITAQVMEVI